MNRASIYSQRTSARMSHVDNPQFCVYLDARSCFGYRRVDEQGPALLRMQCWAYRSQTVVWFLQHLLQHIPGKILVIWDGLPIHRSRIIEDVLAHDAGQRLQVEQLPGDTPDLNLVEYVCRYSSM